MPRGRRSATTIEEDIDQLQSKVSTQIAETTQKVKQAEAALTDLRSKVSAAETALKQAKAEDAAAQQRAKNMERLFAQLEAAVQIPAATAAETPRRRGRPPKAVAVAAAAAVETPRRRGRPPKAAAVVAPVVETPRRRGRPPKNEPANGKAASKSVPPPPPMPKRRGKSGSGEMTVPERMAQVMGRQVMNAGEVIDAMKAAGYPITSNNPAGYVGPTLNGNRMFAEGPDAENLRMANDGNRVKVHRFTNVAHGKYRVSTSEDIKKELMRLVEDGDAVMSETPADRIFENQNIDVRAAVPQHNFGGA